MGLETAWQGGLSQMLPGFSSCPAHSPFALLPLAFPCHPR